MGEALTQVLDDLRRDEDSEEEMECGGVLEASLDKEKVRWS